jgi:uncharacterized lipoprotein
VKALFPAIAFSLLAACAYSPQQITINPIIDIAGEDYGNGRAVTIAVEDGREVKVLGSRGGVYKDTSTITVANSLTGAIARAAEAKLAVQGFNTNDDTASTQLKIIVEELIYDVPEQSVGKKVSLTAVLKVIASSGNETYSGRYKSNSEQQTVVTPSMNRNQEMVNDLLSDTLTRLFSDPKLKAFLSNI